ncbi:MAG: YhcB family protein [Litorivicinus sp.]
MELVWIYAAVAALIGLAAGFYWGRNSQPDVKIRAELEARARAADEKHAQLSMQIQEHFSETARLVNQLSHQYREVHEHLSNAEKTLTDGQSAEQIQALLPKAPEPETLLEQEAQPRDYADQNGTLAEANQRTSTN